MSDLSRRDFIRTSAATAATATILANGNFAYAAAGDTIRVALIGCGGRGTGALTDNMNSGEKGLEVVALGDVFKDRVDGCYNYAKGAFKERCKVTPETCFSGFDAYKKVLATNVDLVILATPPGFRPIHFAAAIEAGKNVFMEKPVAVDPAGVRKVIAAAKMAKDKKLGVVAGTQRRHQRNYVETMKRIHDGQIGDIVGGQVYWNQGGLWSRQKEAGWSDMEWQIRNWLYLTWLSGDHIVEQHVHNIDVANWAFNTHPDKVVALGGREVRKDPVFGQIFDHFAMDYVYPNDVHVLSMCRQIDGCASNVSERIVGTLGTTNCSGWIGGKNAWNIEGDTPPPYVQEHIDLIKSIRAGTPLNEGQRIAESTLTAIMGRMSAYTGKEVTWDFAMNKSTLDITPKTFEMGKIDVPAVAIPGTTKLE